MFSHVFVSVTDFERALAFYTPLMQALGLELRFCEPDKPWAGWHSAGGQRPLFVICKPYNGQPHAPGNGQMTAFSAADRATVDAAYRTALADKHREHVHLVREGARGATGVQGGGCGCN